MTATRSRSARSVDPRMQARRKSVARSEGLRRLWIVAGLTAVASLAIGAIAIANSSWLDIETISVEGHERANRSQIITASGIELGEPLVEVDLDGATRSVEAVPWVAEAVIDRKWSGEVIITVTERVGVIALPTGARHAVVDRTGQQLELLAERPAAFLPVVGVEASGVPGQPVTDDAMSAVALAVALTPELIAASNEIVVEDGQLMLGLIVGGRANLGDVRSLPDKLVAIETILQRVDLTCLDVIDVRVPSAPTVRRITPVAAEEEPFGASGGC